MAEPSAVTTRTMQERSRCFERRSRRHYAACAASWAAGSAVCRTGGDGQCVLERHCEWRVSESSGQVVVDRSRVRNAIKGTRHPVCRSRDLLRTGSVHQCTLRGTTALSWKLNAREDQLLIQGHQLALR